MLNRLSHPGAPISVFCFQSALDLSEERMWSHWLSRGGRGFQRSGLKTGLEDGGGGGTRYGTLRPSLWKGPGDSQADPVLSVPHLETTAGGRGTMRVELMREGSWVWFLIA